MQPSDMTLSAAMRRIHETDIANGGIGFENEVSKRRAVPNGLRSTFRDWAAENSYDSDMAEIHLAHTVGTRVTQAYFRTDMVKKQRDMMATWGQFLTGKEYKPSFRYD